MIPTYPLTNFEIRQFYQNEPRFNGVFSRDNLSEMKNGSYVINLDEYADLGTNWIALFIEKLKLFISIVLVLNMFLKKLKNSWEIKREKLTYLEYKQVVQ